MINLGFLIEGKALLLYSSHLPLGVPNWPVIYFINPVASPPLVGEKNKKNPLPTS
jgi:hypothetical protein